MGLDGVLSKNGMERQDISKPKPRDWAQEKEPEKRWPVSKKSGEYAVPKPREKNCFKKEEITNCLQGYWKFETQESAVTLILATKWPLQDQVQWRDKKGKNGGEVVGLSGTTDSAVEFPWKWSREMGRAGVGLVGQGILFQGLVLNLRYLQCVKFIPVMLKFYNSYFITILD